MKADWCTKMWQWNPGSQRGPCQTWGVIRMKPLKELSLAKRSVPLFLLWKRLPIKFPHSHIEDSPIRKRGEGRQPRSPPVQFQNSLAATHSCALLALYFKALETLPYEEQKVERTKNAWPRENSRRCNPCEFSEGLGRGRKEICSGCLLKQAH